MTNHMDELARALASGMSRRRALRVFGAGVLGSAGAALRPGTAQAKPGGNSSCAHFCNSVFGADTPEADACISDAAHGRGACYDCGPKSDGTRVLCGTVCCSSDEHCLTTNGGRHICVSSSIY